MPDVCTCGAQLPPDARFCHICGKPQREELVPEITERQAPPVIAPSVQARVEPPRINFHNPAAVRSGLTMAGVASLLSVIPLLNLGFVIWWTSAGFFSVYLYKRRTGQLLSVRNGLRMGWITGLLTFVIMTVLFTMTLIPLSMRKGGLAGVYQDQLRNMPMADPSVEQAIRLFQSPAGLAMIIAFTLAFLFAVIMVLSVAGGALGAKIAERE